LKILEYYILIKRSTLLLIMAVISVSCLGQKNVKIDSLLEIVKIQKDNTSKVNSLNALSRLLWETGKYAEARNYVNEALSLSQNIQFNTGEIHAYVNIGLICLYEANYPEALINFHDAYEISKLTGNKAGIFDAKHGIAGVYWNQGNYNDALDHLISNLSIAKEIGDKNRLSKCLNGIGIIYQEQGNYPESIKNHIASLKIKEETGDKRGISASYANLGIIYQALGNHKQALKNYFKSLKLKEEIGDKMGIADAYLNIGVIYQNEGSDSEALKNYFSCLKIKEEIGDKKGIALSYNTIGSIYEKQKNYSFALKYFFAALELEVKIGHKKGIARSNINIGNIYFELKNFPLARKFFNECLSLSKEIGSKSDLKNTYANLAKLDSATGNWEEAYKNHKLYILYRDSLLNEDNSKKMLQTQLQYEFDKKEDSLHFIQALTNEKLKQQSLLNQQQQQSLLMKENLFTIMLSEKKLQQLELEKNQADYGIQKAESEKKQNELLILNKEKAIQTLQLKKQKLLQTYLFLVLILFSILSVFIYKHYNTKQKLKLQTLRNKIASDLHDDVGSTLSSISIFSQMAQQHSREVIPHLETIKQSSQKMLDAMADIVWTINPENDQMEKIVLRMKSFAYELLGAKNIDFEFIADEEVTNLKLLMDERKNLYLIFKEATNNMVKYSGADKALFSLTATKNKLTFLIQDNGRGFDAGNVYKGNGLKNMRKRAEEIGGQLHIQSLPGKGTTIELNVAV
jgi:two-component system, NarL family, sensor histidine kinase UhpB